VFTDKAVDSQNLLPKIQYAYVIKLLRFIYLQN